MLSRQDCKDELWIELSLLKKSQLQASQPLCLLSCGHVFGVSFFFFFFCGGFHSLPPTMWIMSSTDSSQWSDPPVNQWNLTTMSRSGPSCWDWPALLHTPLPPTHRHSHCLKLHKIQGGEKAKYMAVFLHDLSKLNTRVTYDYVKWESELSQTG